MRTLVFDKTGTLTTGLARIAAIESYGDKSETEPLRLAASLHLFSTHPIANALRRAAQRRGLGLATAEAVEELPGAGIAGVAGGRQVRLGTLDFAGGDAAAAVAAETIRRAARDGAVTVFIGIGGRLASALVVADEIRAETPHTLRDLHRAGIARVVVRSGDRLDMAEAVAAAVGVDTVLAERSPEDKLDAGRAERAEAVTVMVGDGVNDAPALAAADVGVAMGARGAGAASEAADIVLLVDRLDRLGEGIVIARHTRRIALESVLAGIGLSFVGMLAAAFGYLPPVAGALVQEVIDVAVILNALRAIGGGLAHPARDRLATADLDRLKAEHAGLSTTLDRLVRLAERLDEAQNGTLVPELRAVDEFLQTEILPHERADERELHPALARLLGGSDPMAALSRTHREIGHLIRRFHRLVAELPETGPEAIDRAELRRTLYGLEAILRLHFAQEDEIYESVAAQPGR